MNAALIFAGGVGARMSSKSLPKQFLLVNGKPIIVHTLEVFQNHPQIDRICVVCVEPYLEHMRQLCQKYFLTKVEWIVPGGKTGQDSIFHGLQQLHAACPEDTVVLIHDGVRPIIDQQLITDNIESVLQNGSAVSCAKATETPAEVGEDGQVAKILHRQCAVVAKAPQSFFCRDIFAAHTRARAEGREDFIDSASMMAHYGYPLHMVTCQWDNIKITTPSDFYIFRAILQARENSQIFGL